MHDKDDNRLRCRSRLRNLSILTACLGVFAGLVLWFRNWVSDPLVAAVLASLVMLGILTIFAPHRDHTG